MDESIAKYQIGQVIHHRLFAYRGVVVDVDPTFQHTEEWYSLMATTNPPKEQPWYRVLIDDTNYISYVAEQNLEKDNCSDPIHHPDLEKYFSELHDGKYTSKLALN